MDMKSRMKCTVGKQNIPLVYGNSMLWSENWVKFRSDREDSRRAEQETHGGGVESMDVVEL